MKKTIITIFVLLMVIASVQPANINLKDEGIKLGVDISGNYYVVTVQDKKITKVEYMSQEEVSFTVQTSKIEIFRFIQEYPNLNYFQRILYLNQEFNIPISLLISMGLT